MQKLKRNTEFMWFDRKDLHPRRVKTQDTNSLLSRSELQSTIAAMNLENRSSKRRTPAHCSSIELSVHYHSVFCIYHFCNTKDWSLYMKQVEKHSNQLQQTHVHELNSVTPLAWLATRPVNLILEPSLPSLE